MLHRMRGLLVRGGAVLTGDPARPVVAGFEPLWAQQDAVMVDLTGPRQTPGRHPAGGWLPEQRLSLSAALAAYTSGTAWQCFDDIAGRLVEGSPADLVALGADLTRVFDHEIADVPVMSTWRRGERTTP